MGLSHTVSGDIASFRTPSRVPIESLKFHFLPKQEGSGDPSPINVRPITGWTGLNGKRASKNLAHVVGYSATSVSSSSAQRQTENSYGTTISTVNYTSPDTALVVTQAATGSPDSPSSYKNGYFEVIVDNLELDKYYDVSFKITNVLSNPLNVTLEDIKTQPPSGSSWSVSEVKNGNILIFRNKKFAVGNNPDRKAFTVRNCGMSFTISEFMITPANKSDGVFEPYSGELIPITFPDGQTIYGGYIDPANGKIRAEYGSYTFTGIEADHITYYGENTTADISRHVFQTTAIDRIAKNTSTINALSNIAAPNNWTLPRTSDCLFYIGTPSTQLTLYIKDTECEATVESFNAWLALHPWTIVFQLATPIEYDIDPISLQAFLDHNNFWSNANDITEVTYPVIESKDILTIHKKAQAFNDYFQGELIFELNGDDAPVDGKWIERVNGYPFELIYDASYDSENKIYNFSNYGLAVKRNSSGNNPINLGNHFRVEWDVYYNRSNSPTSYIMDIGSLTSADRAIGFKLLPKNSSNITPNWKMYGNESNPFSYSNTENQTHPTEILANGEYAHLVGFHEIIPYNHEYDIFRLKINDKIKKYSTIFPKASYGPPWNSSITWISVGGGVYNIGYWTAGSSPNREYITDIKIKSIKIYKYD